MPAPIVHFGATITCFHQGLAQPTVLSPRVLVSRQMVVTLATPYVVAGCALSTTSTPPCVSAQWVTGATRVLAGGNPVIIQTSQAVCTPTGQGLRVAGTQTRVLAT
ncbi:MAG: hypothetical protein QOE70_854 [Chthoniobacter sp.]|jgi:hypothetical protein|nr:hypothetical protein [Chthoniobacter sp.]